VRKPVDGENGGGGGGGLSIYFNNCN